MSDNSAPNVTRNAISAVPVDAFVAEVCLGLQLSHRGQDSITSSFFIEFLE